MWMSLLLFFSLSGWADERRASFVKNAPPSLHQYPGGSEEKNLILGCQSYLGRSMKNSSDPKIQDLFQRARSDCIKNGVAFIRTYLGPFHLRWPMRLQIKNQLGQLGLLQTACTTPVHSEKLNESDRKALDPQIQSLRLAAQASCYDRIARGAGGRLSKFYGSLEMDSGFDKKDAPCGLKAILSRMNHVLHEQGDVNALFELAKENCLRDQLQAWKTAQAQRIGVSQ